MKKIIAAVIILAGLGYFFYPEKVITYPPGILAEEDPVQMNLPAGQIWEKGDYTIEALASYKIKARVLSRNNFSMDKESDLSPLDLALGWGPMSDQNFINQIEVTQSSRWYHWHADYLPMPANEISLHSANVHIIPKDDEIKDQFDDVYKGSLIEMQGYLVKVTAEGGWRWVSSLRRDDTGGGSCELFYVEDVKVLDAEE